MYWKKVSINQKSVQDVGVLNNMVSVGTKFIISCWHIIRKVIWYVTKLQIYFQAAVSALFWLSQFCMYFEKKIGIGCVNIRKRSSFFLIFWKHKNEQAQNKPEQVYQALSRKREGPWHDRETHFQNYHIYFLIHQNVPQIMSFYLRYMMVS